MKQKINFIILILIHFNINLTNVVRKNLFLACCRVDKSTQLVQSGHRSGYSMYSIVYANSESTDYTPRSVDSDLGMCCLAS